jgi:very-long-chain enoyl-CoA reductase
LFTIGAIPRGYGFDLVTCPNYTFEILAWTAVAAMSGSWAGKHCAPYANDYHAYDCHAAWLFVAVSGYQMTAWAVKKHKQYKKEFGNTYPRRRVIFPFIF